ncbi:MAG TPA: SWIM zinc finger family protein [Dehalococcoidia bacterium]|nr:SWIM zinc finger family protein [Dehalococcoidia bacterium]
MNSSVIGKIEKAKRYAQERDRMRFSALSVHFHGENDDHEVTLAGEKWHCTCEFFEGHGTCAHSMALEHVLEGMLPEAATHLQHV